MSKFSQVLLKSLIWKFNFSINFPRLKFKNEFASKCPRNSLRNIQQQNANLPESKLIKKRLSHTKLLIGKLCPVFLSNCIWINFNYAFRATRVDPQRLRLRFDNQFTNNVLFNTFPCRVLCCAFMTLWLIFLLVVQFLFRHIFRYQKYTAQTA